MVIVVIVLVAVVGIFGVSSGMQSYATAQQAQAQIEVAKVAQVNAWGNLVTILTGLFLILVVVALFVVVVWFLLKIKQQQAPARPGSRSLTSNPSPMLDMNNLNALIMLKILEKLDGSGAPQLPAPQDDRSEDESFRWLQLK